MIGGIGHLHGDVTRVGGHGLHLFSDGLVGIGGIPRVGLGLRRRNDAGGLGSLGRDGHGIERLVIVVLSGQRFVVDDRVEQSLDVFGSRLLVALVVGVSDGRHRHEGDASGVHTLQRLAQPNQIAGLHVVDKTVVHEGIDDLIELVQVEEGVGGDH